jgi:Ca-activated chloride channel family protein
VILRRTAAILAIAAVPAIAGSTAAQETLRVDVRLVTVVATVTDADGRYVSDLTAEDFIVEDNGAPQTIVAFNHDRAIPVSLGILIDASSSMARRMRTSLAAVDRFIRTLYPGDDVFLATFASDVRLVEDLTSDRERLTRALGDIREAGRTSLYDGVAMGIEKVYEGRHDKRAILLLTDGSDVASELELGEVLERLERAEVLVYGLGIEPVESDATEHVRFNWPVTAIPGAPGLPRMRALDQPVDMNVLRRFAAASGGKAYQVSGTWDGGTIDDVDRILDEVAAELRSQYTLAYYPSPESGDARFHRIRVRVRDADYTVRACEGYAVR